MFGARRAGWPPSEGWRERRKYLVQAGGRGWIARFAGLGASGEAALGRARALAAARLVPAPAGLRHGFLVETFEERARPLPLASVPRVRVLGAVRRHLAFVAGRFPAGDGEGATPRDLVSAAVECALSPGEAAELAVAVREASAGAPPRCLPVYLAAYAAFEGGRWSAAAAEPGLAPDEAARRRAEADRLADALRRALRAGAPAGPGARGTLAGR